MRFLSIVFVVLATSLTNVSFAEFSTVIDFPSPGSEPLPQQVGSDTQINLFPVGSFQTDFVLMTSDNIELNVLGGNAGKLWAGDGTTVNLSSGTIIRLDANGTEVNISGGLIRELKTYAGGSVNVVAKEFRLNGEPFPAKLPNGYPFDFSPGKTNTYLERDSVLSGTFASGKTFSWNLDQDDPERDFQISPNTTLTLTVVPEPTTANLATICLLALFQVRARRRRRDAAIGPCG